MSQPKPISDQARPRKAPWWPFLIFLLIGLGLLLPMFILPAWRVAHAGHWVATPCVIVSSSVESHSSDDGDTYSIDISYTYVVNDRPYQSNRYDFMGGSSSGFKGKKAIVDRYPPGRQATCYVDPANPAEAVLERGFVPTMWFGLIPMAFILMGGLGIYFTLRSNRKARLAGRLGQSNAGRPARSAVTTRPAGPVTLKPQSSRLSTLLGLLIFAVFWNGIVLTIFLATFRDFGEGTWFSLLSLLFFVPFVLVGVGVMFVVLYQLLCLFNPRPELTLSSARLQPGQMLEVRWQFWGRASSVRTLEIWLEGREEVTYTRGTTTCHDKNVFLKALVIRTDNIRQIPAGEASVTIPADAVPSFDAPHNKIVWCLRTKGEIAFWPDVDDEFPFEIGPLPLPVESKA